MTHEKTNPLKNKSLIDKVKSFEFHPEVYVYPTPRTYRPLENLYLENMDFDQDINLYIHIPFCKQICNYCGYLKVLDSTDLKSQYVDSLIKEIIMYKDILKDKTVNTLHFGGGTPSLLSIDDFKKIFNTLFTINPNILSTSKEISIEATPESVEPEKFSKLLQLGINRISMGIQTLNDLEINFSRRHNLNTISLNAIKTLQSIGIPNIVADLMIGITGQTVKSFEDSLIELIGLRPDTVELYALGLMPNTSINKNKSDLMSNKDIYECYSLSRTKFSDSGYIQDCHNRYTLPNRGSFLQEDNIFKNQDLIGFGAGARSYLKNIHYRNSYQPNFKNAIEYYFKKINNNNNKIAVSDGIILSPEEKIRQYAIYNLESLDLFDFKEKFKIGFNTYFPSIYNELLELGLAIESGQKLKLTDSGLNFRDLIAYQIFSKNVLSVEEVYRK